MGGLLVLALIAGYVWGAVKLFKHVRLNWAKALVVVTAILIPMADAVYGRIKLKQMCEAEAGLIVYRAIDGVDGFYDPSTRPLDEWITKYGYKFVEGNELSGKHARITLGSDGKVVLERNVTPISKYIYEYSIGEPSSTYDRIEKWVRIRDTDEIIGRAVMISYAGGWVERLIGSISDSRGIAAATCGPDISQVDLVSKTLRPKK
jgi:hypothetical protein